MPKTWKAALGSYRYPVTRLFSDASKYPQWQDQPRLPKGDRTETMAFEAYFRASGQSAIVPWAVVVFWKLVRGGNADTKTREILNRWKATRPQTLWDALTAYIEQPTEVKFDRFRSLFGFEGKGIAVVATFPAFVAPDRFPMVDQQIAKWVQNHCAAQNDSDPIAPRLEPTSHNYVLPPKYVLKMRDFSFMQQWTAWCRHTAQKLAMLTGEEWRARDVEMAVFQAQRDSRPLNPLPPPPCEFAQGRK